jgi:formate dehydrogenase subunit gamma
MVLFFVVMAWRFWQLNMLEPRDIEWLAQARKMVDGDDHDMPEQGKYNGGQKLLFWGLVIGMVC